MKQLKRVYEHKPFAKMTDEEIFNLDNLDDMSCDERAEFLEKQRGYTEYISVNQQTEEYVLEGFDTKKSLEELIKRHGIKHDDLYLIEG